MDRRVLLSTIGAATILSGCLSSELVDDQLDDRSDQSGNGPETDSVRDHFRVEPERPECTKESETVEIEHRDGETNEYETAATVPYPNIPTEFTDDALVEYAEAFERAFVTHNLLCDRDRDDYVLSIANGIDERETFDWYDDITIVYLRRFAGASHGISEDGAEWQSDIGATVACYAIDETGVARVQTEYRSPDEYDSDGANPIDEGTLVLAFE